VVPKTESDKDFTTGERNLPPVNARVFVMMPSGTFDDCFVLCSGFSSIEKDANAPFMEDDKEKIREKIIQGGWHTKYDCVTGSFEGISPDEKTGLKIDYGTEEEEKEHPELHLALFEETTLDIIDEDSAKLSVFGGEIKVEHKKGDNAKITVFDTEMVIKQGEVSFMSTSAGKFKIGNTVATIGDMINDLLTALQGLHTEGSPAAHTATAWAAQNISPLIAKWKQVFE
jgi:hypothetical protein